MKKKPELRAYTFNFKGCYLGGQAVVVAESPEAARAILDTAHPRLHDDAPDGLQNVHLNAVSYPIPGCVLFDDGDY